MNVSTALVLLGAATLALAASDYQSGIDVVFPEKGSAVIAGRTYTVEWTGTGPNSFVEIDLFYCQDCAEDECGEWLTSLCPYGERGCPDNEGDYDVVMPQPIPGTSGDGSYKIRIGDKKDEGNTGCSGAFSVYATEKDVDTEGEGTVMTVTAPAEDDMAYAGEVYTVEFVYRDVLGSSTGRFNIDLFRDDGRGGCGTYVSSLCDKPSIGCKDSKGDYDVEIPFSTPSGYYRVQVSLFDDTDVSDCSASFEVVSEVDAVVDESDPAFSMSFSF